MHAEKVATLSMLALHLTTRSAVSRPQGCRAKKKIAAQSMLAAMKECTGTYPTLGMPTQFPELKRTSQNLSYWKRKAALDLHREQCERLLAELYTIDDHKSTNNTLAAGLWPLQIEHFCVAILRPRQQAAGW